MFDDGCRWWQWADTWSTASRPQVMTSPSDSLTINGFYCLWSSVLSSITGIYTLYSDKRRTPPKDNPLKLCPALVQVPDIPLLVAQRSGYKGLSKTEGHCADWEFNQLAAHESGAIIGAIGGGARHALLTWKKCLGWAHREKHGVPPQQLPLHTQRIHMIFKQTCATQLWPIPRCKPCVYVSYSLGSKWWNSALWRRTLSYKWLSYWQSPILSTVNFQEMLHIPSQETSEFPKPHNRVQSYHGPSNHIMTRSMISDINHNHDMYMHTIIYTQYGSQHI